MAVGLLSGSWPCGDFGPGVAPPHSATDGLSSLLGLIANGLSDPQGPDRDHPYGHIKL